MDTVHMVVGTLVVLAFVALTIVNIMRLTGRSIGWARPLSFAASGLLLVQYALGFSLLGGESSVSAWHYLIALSAILTVGLEHSMASTPRNPTGNLRLATLGTSLTTVLVLVAYAIGSSN